MYDSENMKTDFESFTIDDAPKGTVRAAIIQLAVFKARKSPLIEYMQKNIKKEVNIEEVRNRLSKISASMSQEIAESRAERL